MSSYRLQLTGRAHVVPQGGAPLALSLREAALLAWLHLEGPTPRSRIAGLLWPDGTESQARANLRQALARLRRNACGLVSDQAGTLALAAGVAVDADAAEPLLGAMAFDTLPEFAQWLAARREEAQRGQERERAAQGRRCLERGDLDGALAAADALLAAQPESETAWCLRMEALYLRGDRAAAIAAWDACRLALRQAFGIAPSAATNALGRLILSSDAPPGAPAMPALPLPSSLRRPPRLVGREALCQGLARHLALGGSALLAGPGGVGKSRLMERAVTAPGATLWVGARPGDALVPGGVIGQILARAIESFAPPLDATTAADVALWLPSRHDGLAAVPAAGKLRSDLARRRATDAVCRTLDACHARGLRLLVVDDLQLADNASLELLHVVLGRWLSAASGGAAPRMLLGARTQELTTAGRALVAALTGHEQGRIFNVPPLEPACIEELIDSLELPGTQGPAWGDERRALLARALHAAVGGSPAHVLEALRHLVLDGLDAWSPGRPLPVPGSLLETMQQRLARLPAEALQLAQLAAVAQTDFDIGLAEAALARPALALAPLLAALEEAWVFDGKRFSHDLVAEAVRSLLPKALVPTLHRRIAEHLVARGDADAARVAHHLLAAEARHQAAPWLTKAALAARSRWQLAEAAETYAMAARIFEAAAQPGPALDAWCDALRCWVELRRFDATQQALDEAWRLAHSAEERARLRTREVLHLFHSRRMGEAVAAAQVLADEVAASVADLDPEELVYALRSVCLAVQGGLPAARVLALCDRAQGAVVQRGGEALAGFALARGGTLLWDGRPLQAAAELESAWRALAPDCDPYLRRSVGNQLMRVRQALGDLSGAVALGQALLSPQPGAQDASFEADVLSLVAMMQVAQGRAAEGLRSIDEMCRRLQSAGEPMRELYAISSALSCLALGRDQQAQHWLDRHTQPAGREGYAMVDYPALLARARLAQARGEPVEPWIERIRAVGGLSAGGLLHREVALAALCPGPLPALVALLGELRERGQQGLMRTVEIAAARAALRAGDRRQARHHALAALKLAHCVDAWSDQAASVWLHGHDVLMACDAVDAAHAALSEGVRWIELGARPWTHEADRRAWREGNGIHRALLARWAAVR